MASGVPLPHPDTADIDLTSVLFALSDPERLDIVRQLTAGPLDLADCTLRDPSMPKSTKSHLFKVLREAGLVRNEPTGRSRRLTLRADDLEERFPGLLDSIVRAAGT